MIKNIIFDVNEVLTRRLHDYKWSNNLLAEKYGVSLDKIGAFFDEFTRFGGTLHGMSIEEFWKMKTIDIYPVPLSAVVASAHRHKTDLVIDREMIDLLIKLQPNYRLFALTNTWNPGHAFKDELKQYFESFVQSCDINLQKPDRAIFQYMCDTYLLLPTETAFIDNRQENVDAACSFGMHAILFKTFTDLIESFCLLEVIKNKKVMLR